MYQLSKNQTCHQPLEVYPLHYNMLNLIKYSHLVDSNLTQRFHHIILLSLPKADLWSPKNRNQPSTQFRIMSDDILSPFFPLTSIAPPIRL